MSTRCQIEFYYPTEAEQAEPAARIYQHSDGYPSNMLPRLRELEKALSTLKGIYGTRQDDPEWAAAEFISRYRPPSDAAQNGEHGSVLHYGRKAYQGNVYVSMQIHEDIEYLYRVTCARKWTIEVFRPEHGDGPGFDIQSFGKMTPAEVKVAG